MQKPLTIYAASVKELFYKALQQGASIDQLEEKTGIKPEHLANPDNRISLDKHVALWHAVIELTQNPSFALQLGENSNTEDAGIISLVIMNAPTLGDMFSRIKRYIHLIAESDRIEIVTQQEHVHLRYIIEVPEYFTTYAIERSFSMAFNWSKIFTGEMLNPVEIHFQYSAPEYIDEYQRIFKTDLLFEQPHNAIVFDKAVLELPNINYNNYLDNVISVQADKLMGKLSSNDNLVRKTYKLIVHYLPTGDLNVDTISSEMNMSRRTLARKLKDQGVSFQDLVEQTKKDLSLDYLQQNSISISDVAYMLGFSETSAFSRAFKRWFGDNPQTYRKTLNAPVT